MSIKLKNIDILTGHHKIIGKGGKVREIPLKSEALETIKEYLVERNNKPYEDSEYLILGERGAIQRDVVNTIFEKYTNKGNSEDMLSVIHSVQG